MATKNDGLLVWPNTYVVQDYTQNLTHILNTYWSPN